MSDVTVGYCNLREGYRNQLEDPCRHDECLLWLPNFQHFWFSCRGGYLYVRAGYAWDGASGPTIDSEATTYPSLIHDVLYQAMGEGLIPSTAINRRRADVLFRKLLKRDGMSFTRRWVWYYSVRAFGPRKGSRKRRIVTSPRR